MKINVFPRVPHTIRFAAELSGPDSKWRDNGALCDPWERNIHRFTCCGLMGNENRKFAKKACLMSNKNAKQDLEYIAEAMKNIDFVMLNTHTANGQIGARPMSNNRQVDFDGDSYYFTWEDCRMVDDIKSNPKVGLSLQGSPSSDGAPGIFISVEGKAEIIRDKMELKEHWTDELNRWFKAGVDTEGMVLLHVQATRAAYWDGNDEVDFDIQKETS
jgi:general stress protein 26